MEKKARKQLVDLTATTPGITRTLDQLRSFQLPEFLEQPVPFLAPPMTDGLRCNACAFIARQPQSIRKHCQTVHGWVNDRKRIDNFKKGPREDWPVPWTNNIHCQRFFPTRVACGWVEVRQPSTESRETEEEVQLGDWLAQFHDRQQQRFKDAERQAVVEEVDQKLESNAWLGRVGWSTHLDKLDPEMLRATTEPAGDEETTLRQMCESLDRVMDSAKGLCRASKVGLSALFEINRREIGKKPAQPFNARMEDDSWTRYKDVWRKLMCIWYRTQQHGDETRPPYRFNSEQQAIWDQFVLNARVRDGTLHRSATGIMLSDTSFDYQCLELIMTFLDHQIPEDDYQNAIISALAVLGIRQDGGWHDPCEYTPILSAVVKVARMLAIRWAYEHRQADIKKMMRERDIEECVAREKVKSMFLRVREMVRRFMTRVGDGRTAQPGPMDWILETRTYGMNIRFNTTAGGSIDWNDRRVQYKRIAFDMNQLTEMLCAVVEEARNLLADLAMVSEDGIEKLPAIPWNQFEDDMSEDAVGYSFLRDRRNSTWLSKGKHWNVNQISASKVLQHEWISHDQNQGHPYKMKAVKDHGRKFDKFREKLWLLVHMLSGQPARATEILGIRHRNTNNGGTRNIFVSKGEVCFVTAYHKNFQQTFPAKSCWRIVGLVFVVGIAVLAGCAGDGKRCGQAERIFMGRRDRQRKSDQARRATPARYGRMRRLLDRA
ncbi:hypothetical protein E4U17_001581 [Claviceps sp. LM77 group G4]|nr:hypothetical protein E4U17_001581 [Claviceps sp. LM77 group G4]